MTMKQRIEQANRKRRAKRMESQGKDTKKKAISSNPPP